MRSSPALYIPDSKGKHSGIERYMTKVLHKSYVPTVMHADEEQKHVIHLMVTFLTPVTDAYLYIFLHVGYTPNSRLKAPARRVIEPCLDCLCVRWIYAMSLKLDLWTGK